MFTAIATLAQTAADNFTDRYLLKGRKMGYQLEVRTDRQAAYIDWQIENYGVGSGRFFEPGEGESRKERKAWAKQVAALPPVKPFVFED